MSKTKILYPDTKNGIYSYDYPTINGMKQYVQIRGCDRKNPVILFLHGGPGDSLAGICDVLQHDWEKEYTVVNFDQRNTCKTYLKNKDVAQDIAEKTTLEDYLADIDGVIKHLHTVIEFDKIILIGFSWGSIIGAEYAKHHPENVAKYIGIGQLVNYREAIEYICAETEKMTTEPKEKAILDKMRELCSSANEMTDEFMGGLRRFAMLAAKYNIKDAKKLPIGKILRSPYLNFTEKKAMLFSDWKLKRSTFRILMNYNFRQDMNFKMPVLFTYGTQDISCPSKLLENCFDKINSPSKKICIIEKAGHCCFYDQPEKFNDEMRRFIKA